jgi:competence protein ComGC
MREDSGIDINGGGGSADLGGTEVSTLTEVSTQTEPRPVSEPAGRARGFSLAQMLVEGGILSSDQVNRAQEEARRERLPLGQILVRDDLVASRVLATLTALHLGLTMVELRAETIDRAAVRMVPEDVARKYMVLALNQKDGHLTVAMADPTDLQLLQDLAARTGRIIDPVVTTGEDIQEHINLYYRLSEALESTDVDEDFTLIEMLVVVGIIVALAAVIVPTVIKFSGSGEAGAKDAERDAVQSSIDLMMSDNELTSVAANTTTAAKIVRATTDFGSGQLITDYFREPETTYCYLWATSGEVTDQQDC